MPAEAEARLRRAREETIATGSARVSHSLRADEPDGDVHNPALSGIGVVDFAACRAELENEDQAHAGTRERTVYAGVHCYYGPMPDGLWRDFSFGWGQGSARPIPLGSPLWLLEALTHLRPEVMEGGSAEVRGNSVERFRVAVALPPGPVPRLLRPLARHTPADVTAEIWLDSQDRVRLCAGLKPAAPRFPDWYPARLREATEAVEGTTERRVWDTAEFWDFGVAATITPPRASEILAPRAAIGRFFDPRRWARQS